MDVAEGRRHMNHGSKRPSPGRTSVEAPIDHASVAGSSAANHDSGAGTSSNRGLRRQVGRRDDDALMTCEFVTAVGADGVATTCGAPAGSERSRLCFGVDYDGADALFKLAQVVCVIGHHYTHPRWR
jgi:hypothetical protein